MGLCINMCMTICDRIVVCGCMHICVSGENVSICVSVCILVRVVCVHNCMSGLCAYTHIYECVSENV